MTASELASLLAAIAVILGAARLLGRLAQRLGQPAVVGEIVAGILLGPTLLGTFLPGVSGRLFPDTLPFQAAFSALATLSVCLFMVVAGMEVELKTIRQEGKKAVVIGAVGTLIPLFLSLGLAFAFPRFWGSGGVPRHVFALYFATAISISALPVIIRILTDLRLFKSNFGMMVVAVAMLKDLFGWFLFSVVLALAGAAGADHHSPALTISLTLALVALALTAGRKLVRAALPRVQKNFPWPGGVLTFIFAVSLFTAALAEWIGVHAVFGAFLGGVLFGDALRSDAKTREITEQFIVNIFAPIFFASIGFHANFITAFQPGLVLAVLGLAVISKVFGFFLGARLAGLRSPEAPATAFALLSSGIMGIILGLVGLQTGLITRELFVALVIMALVTSILSGPLLSATLRLRKRKGLLELLDPDLFIPDLPGRAPGEAVRALARPLSQKTGQDAAVLAGLVEESSDWSIAGLGSGLAVAHGQLPGLQRSFLAVGRSVAGLDFNSPDGKSSHWLFLLLTPEHDHLEQIHLLRALTRRCADEAFRHQLRQISSFHEFRRLIETTHEAESGGPEEPKA